MRIAICEDIDREAEVLLEVLGRHLERNSLEAEIERFTCGEDFLVAFEPGRYQLIFMDIYMKPDGLTGMETAKRVSEADEEATIIFTTSNDELGIPGYKYSVYYIVKPVSDSEMEYAMKKCRSTIQKYAKTIEINVNRRPLRLRLHDILYVESQRRACVFVTTTEEARTNMAFEQLVEQLGGPPFYRCHRSYYVNLSRAKDKTESDFIMKNGHKVPIGRSYRREAEQVTTEWIREKMMEHE